MAPAIQFPSGAPGIEDREIIEKLDELRRDLEALKSDFQRYTAKVRRALLEAEGGEAC